jgi:O-acetyl-ADP-ribose deacetylase (regulator of RNase III)
MINVVMSDICTIEVDVIVNSANTNLLAGGGVCGAIHRAAGPELEAACRPFALCPTGKAIITAAYNLPAKHVIHAVGPRYLDGSRGEKALLVSTYQAIAELMRDSGCKSIAIPSISTGIYRYPLDEAAKIAINTMLHELSPEVECTFVCFDQKTTDAYGEALQ